MPAQNKKDGLSQKHGLPRTAIRLKRSRRTINDLLTSDEVNGILGELDKVKPHITDCIVIYTDKRDGKFHWQVTDNTLASLAVWLLESAKLDLLTAGDEE